MKLIFVAFALICLANQSVGQTVFNSLEDLWKYAAEHNPEMSTSMMQNKIAYAGLQQAQHSFLPAISINAGFTDNINIQPTLVPAELFGGQPGTYVEEQFGKRYNYNTGVVAQLDILNMEKLYRLKGAHNTALASELGLEVGKRNVYHAISNAYFSYYLMAETERLAAESLTALQGITDHSAELYEKGIASESAVNTTSAYSKRAYVTLITAQQSRRSALNDIKQLIDFGADDTLLLPGEPSFDQSSEDDPAIADARSSVTVRLAEAQMWSSKTSWYTSKASYAPVLSVVYGYNTQFTGDEFWKFTNTNRLPQQYWGLRVSVPIVAEGGRRFNVTRSRLEYENAVRKYESEVRRTTIEDEDMLQAYSSSKQKLQVSREALELYRSNDDHAARQLDAGQISINERLQVYNEYLTYANEYLRGLSEFYISHIALVVRNKTY